MHVSKQTYQRASTYLQQLSQGARAGKRLAAQLLKQPLVDLDVPTFLELLFHTKPPCFFAESQLRGDGSDWTMEELGILGDMGVAVEVQAFDNGMHRGPEVHTSPIPATLLFCPGALLRNDTAHTPADWHEVTHAGQICPNGFRALYSRRLLPLLHHASQAGLRAGCKVVITCPGLGCGQFAGPFAGSLGEHLKTALMWLLAQHSHQLSGIGALYYDPYNECSNETHQIGGINFLVRPFTKNTPAKPQLCRPEVYLGANHAPALLFSIVAWDHVSWPGNDFYAGARATDDGVKAAATDVMYRLTGVKGSYHKASNRYMPPAQYANWNEVVTKNGLRLKLVDRLTIASL